MTKILHVSAGINGDASLSRSLGSALTQGLAANSDAQIVDRNLSQDDPPLLSMERFQAGLKDAAERTEGEAALAAMGDALIAELQDADTIVISAPMYNFGVPASVKAWADLVARAGTTFKYTENGPQGLLEGKKAYIVATSGGVPIGGDMDMMTPWLKFFLGFLGIPTQDVIYADGIMGVDAAEKIAAAKDTIAKITA